MSYDNVCELGLRFLMPHMRCALITAKTFAAAFIIREWWSECGVCSCRCGRRFLASSWQMSCSLRLKVLFSCN